MSQLTDQLVKGLGRKEALRIGHQALRSDAMLSELDHLSTSHDFTIAGKSSWIIALLTEEDPKALVRFSSRWIERLKQGNVLENVRREYLRCLLIMPWSDQVAGDLIDYCVVLLQHHEHDTGVKYNALRILARATSLWPELAPEVTELARRHIHSESAGIRALVRNMLDTRY
jgi:hypothetical protein